MVNTDIAAKIREKLNQPVNIGSIIIFRVFFGLVLMAEIGRYLANGWVWKYYSAGFHFTYPYFDWITPLPWVGMIWFFCFLGVLAFMIACGFSYRMAASLLAVGMSYVFLIDKANYQNQFYLIIVLSLLMAVIPAHRACSYDEKHKPIISADTCPAWCLWILQFQIGLVYLFAGLAKVETGFADWRYLAQWSLFPLELFVFPFLLWQPTKVLAFGVLALFHLINAIWYQTGAYPYLMIVSTTLFLAPDWPHYTRRLWPEMEERRALNQLNPVRPWRMQAAIAIAIIFIVVQVSLPMRQFFYSGNTNWTNEGARFSWRTKLSRKEGQINFYYRSDQTLEKTKISVRKYLNDKQRDHLRIWPDLILDFSHFLAKSLAEKGHTNVEIYASAVVSLDHSHPQLMVEPNMNLAQFPRGRMGAERWIVPLVN